MSDFIAEVALAHARTLADLCARGVVGVDAPTATTKHDEWFDPRGHSRSGHATVHERIAGDYASRFPHGGRHACVMAGPPGGGIPPLRLVAACGEEPQLAFAGHCGYL
ncbi:MAG: hypothetical protein LBI99_01220 [Propionibacteriaceae bacterium]|jgi:hypothetical protein|nr:hypothetical protein [Propionibacteriaceae bacterium]